MNEKNKEEMKALKKQKKEDEKIQKLKEQKINKEKMQPVKYDKTVEIPLAVMWDFVKDFDNWAPMLKGYQTHETIDDKESIWTVRGEFGPFSRVTKFHITITEWVEPKRVAFELRGMNEPVTGYGFVDLIEPGDGKVQTTISSEMGFLAGGALGPLINRLVQPWVSTVAEELVEKLVAAVNPTDFKSEFWPT